MKETFLKFKSILVICDEKNKRTFFDPGSGEKNFVDEFDALRVILSS